MYYYTSRYSGLLSIGLNFNKDWLLTNKKIILNTKYAYKTFKETLKYKNYRIKIKMLNEHNLHKKITFIELLIIFFLAFDVQNKHILVNKL